MNVCIVYKTRHQISFSLSIVKTYEIIFPRILNHLSCLLVLIKAIRTIFKFNFRRYIRFMRVAHKVGCLLPNDPWHSQHCKDIIRDCCKHRWCMAPDNVDYIWKKTWHWNVIYKHCCIAFSVSHTNHTWMDRLNRVCSQDCTHIHSVCYIDLLRKMLVWFFSFFRVNSIDSIKFSAQIQLPFTQGWAHFGWHLVPLLSTVHPSRHEHWFGAVHIPLTHPLIYQIKMNINQRFSMEKNTQTFSITYFGQTGWQMELSKTKPGRQSHFSGATHSPNSQPFVHFGMQFPLAFNS